MTPYLKQFQKIAIMFFTHTFQMIGINTTISGNAYMRLYNANAVEELLLA